VRIAEEIVIEGHEPRHAGELYPSLNRESGLASDLCSFALLPGGGFLSVHQVLPFKSLAEWRDQLLWWKIPYSGP